MTEPVEREYNGWYEGEHTRHTAFPMGGIGAGMICLEGTGAISHVSVRNKPEMFLLPLLYIYLLSLQVASSVLHQQVGRIWKRNGIRLHAIQ